MDALFPNKGTTQMCQDKVSQEPEQQDDMWVMGDISSVGSSMHLSTEHLYWDGFWGC